MTPEDVVNAAFQDELEKIAAGGQIWKEDQGLAGKSAVESSYTFKSPMESYLEDKRNPELVLAREKAHRLQMKNAGFRRPPPVKSHAVRLLKKMVKK